MTDINDHATRCNRRVNGRRKRRQGGDTGFGLIDREQAALRRVLFSMSIRAWLTWQHGSDGGTFLVEIRGYDRRIRDRGGLERWPGADQELRRDFNGALGRRKSDALRRPFT